MILKVLAFDSVTLIALPHLQARYNDKKWSTRHLSVPSSCFFFRKLCWEGWEASHGPVPRKLAITDYSSTRRNAIGAFPSGHLPVYVLELRERLFRTWLRFMRSPPRRWTVARQYVLVAREFAKWVTDLRIRFGKSREEIFRFTKKT